TGLCPPHLQRRQHPPRARRRLYLRADHPRPHQWPALAWRPCRGSPVLRRPGRPDRRRWHPRRPPTLRTTQGRHPMNKPTALEHGSKGQAVIALQKALNTAGANLLVDGDFGDETEKAVRAYQLKKGLVVDGRAG